MRTLLTAHPVDLDEPNGLVVVDVAAELDRLDAMTAEELAELDRLEGIA